MEKVTERYELNKQLAQMMNRLGINHIELRQASDLEKSFDALILPGGESTVQSLLLHEQNIFDPLRTRIKKGMPTLATCAGLILLASEIEGQKVSHFATLPVKVKRNAYGRQLGSFHTKSEVKGIGTIPMTFIRAPYISESAPDVDILSVVDRKITGVHYKNQFAYAFHPELDNDTHIHELFLKSI